MSKVFKAEIGDINAANVQQLRVINISTLPVSYSKQFYADITKKNPQEFMKYAFWNGFAIGAVCARFEPHADPDYSKVYIMTLAVLPEYRRNGVASQLLNHVLELAKKNPKVKEIYLHVQTSNTAARMFYKENFEFEEGEVISNYYKHVEPADAYILRKRFER